LLTAAAVALVLLVAAPLASAQQTQPPPMPPSSGGDSNRNDTSGLRDDARSRERLREERNEGRGDRRRGRGKAAPAVEAQYPEATRVEPDARASRTGTKRLQALFKTYEAGDAAATVAEALEIANDARSNEYEKAFAYQIAGSSASANNDGKAAAEYYGKAIELNGLGNNDHYTSMLNLAMIQYENQAYDTALATLERFQTETRSDRREAVSLRAGILMELGRYTDAAAIYTAQLAADPDNKAARMNAVAAYQQAEQYDKAVELLAEAQAKGQFTTADEYRALYVSYLNGERDDDALAVIDDGVAKGILQKDADLARAYMIVGQNAFYAEDEAKALEMYKRAAPIADNGDAALNLAKILSSNGDKAGARAAAQLALDKGTKEPEQARRLLGSP